LKNLILSSVDGVIAADGASSAVRKSLNLGFEGMTYADRYLVVSTPFELADHLDDLAYVNYISDPDEWLVLLRTVGLWRALFPVGEDETDDEALSDESAERRLQGVVARSEPYEVAHRTIYNVHQRVADTFKVGRVLLAGDAAHINNPLGGMGMNGGVHDAILLGAGLAALLHGSVTDAQLAGFADLRRDLALDYVQRHTHNNAVSLAAPDGAARQKALHDMAMRASEPSEARAYLLQASMLNALTAMRSELEMVGMWP
jgi:3-(3-hydroxy-phenyl)propionate hydroxylase